MAANPKLLTWSIFAVFGICILLNPCVTLTWCNNHTECPTNSPYCCGSILGYCKENCNGMPCKSDKNCGLGECCNNFSICTFKRCRDQCSTNKDCPKGQFCCTQRGSKKDDFNVCDNSCYGKHCMADGDCAATECCKHGWCQQLKDCKNKQEFSIIALVIIVATLVLSVVAVVVCIMACCGYFKRRRFAGAIVTDPPAEQEEQTATTEYVQLEDMSVDDGTDD